MRYPLSQLGLRIALLALGSTLAFAEGNGLDTRFKFRLGLQAGEAKDNLSNHLLSAGVDFGMTTSVGRFGIELGYQYKPGRQYLDAIGNVTVQAGAPALNPLYTKDLRRNQVDGVMARLSYEYAMSKELALHGGLQLGGARFRHEFVGQAASTNPLAATVPGQYADTYNGTPVKSTLAIAPFVGASYRLSETNHVEFNIVAMSYTAIDYRHVAGTVLGSYGGNTSKDTLVESKRMIPHIEVGYVVRF